MPGHIFIDVNNQGAMQKALRTRAAHEAFHDLEERDPDLFHQIALALRKVGAAKLTAAKFQPIYDPTNTAQLVDNAHATSEQIANLFGNVLHNPAKVDELLQMITGGDVSMAAKVVAAIKRAIATIKANLASLGSNYDVSAYAGDLDQAAKILMEGYAKFARSQNVSPVSAELQVMREARQTPAVSDAKQAENREGVIVGARPGEFDWSVAQGGVPAPIQHPVQLAPRVERLGPAVGKILNSKPVLQLVEDLFGITNLKVYPTLGQYKGKPEPSFALYGDNMTFEAADALSRWLGFGLAQESTIVTQPVYANDEDTWPAFYVGNGKKLSAKEVDAVRREAQNLGVDYSTSIDGKYFKFFYDGSDLDQYGSKIAAIAQAAGLKNIDRVQTRSTFNEAANYLGSEAEGTGRQVWLQESGAGSSSLFGRTVDHLIVPYAKAVGAEGYRFSPDLFADRFGLSTQQREYLRAALRPKNGKKLSTAGIIAGTEKLEASKNDTRSKVAKSNNTDVMFALQNRAAAIGQIEPGDYSDEAKKAISEAMADEVITHISRPGGKSAIGWYDAALKRAKEIYDQVFPELKTNKDREMLFDALLGITSQGNDVFSNSIYAGRMYYLITRKGMTISQAEEVLHGSFGGETRAIENNFLKLEELLDRNGYDQMRKLFNKKMTVGEWNALLRRDPTLFYGGEPLKMDGAARQKVNGWMVFGPKIGSFINNLHGDYSTLTADLWFSRTWNRILGFSFLHTPLQEADKYQAFKEALIAEHTKTSEPRSISKDGTPKAWEHGEDINYSDAELDALMADPDAMLALADELYTYYKNGYTFSHDKKDKKNGFSTKSDLRRAAKNWIEHRNDPVAAPRSDNERAFQQETVEAAQRIIKRKTGEAITIADIQAALWYHEKELFAHFGATDKKKKPADYADAARDFMEKFNNGDLFYVEKPSPKYIVGEKGDYLAQPKLSPAVSGGQGNVRQRREDAAGAVRGDPPRYGNARTNSVQVRGVHYSSAQRQDLSGFYHGTGAKGEERTRLGDPRNADLRGRIYFYVDEGQGLFPEQGVGEHAHDADLQNLYDLKADPIGYRKLATSNGVLDSSKMERLIMQGGFDGWYAPEGMGRQGVAVLVGKHAFQPRYIGTGYRGGEAVAPVQAAPAQETDADRVEKVRVLPMGQATGTNWKAMIKSMVPSADVSMLEDGKTYYKSDVVSAMRGAAPRLSPAVVQTETPEFKRWFGDSKVVDADGKPLVVYRALVGEWDDKKATKLNMAWASESADGAADYVGDEVGANVAPVFMSLQNPADLQNDTKAIKIVEDAGLKVDYLYEITSSSAVKKELQAAGYDGIRAYHYGVGEVHYAAFRPEQIKSAIGNNGQFDPTNPDIRLSPAVQPVFYSQLARQIEQAPDRVFSTAPQLKLWLAGNAAKLGIKKDEIQWSGINDWLDLQGKERISKADVMAYLAGSGVQVEEVMKGRDGYDENNPQLPKDSGLDVVRFENLATEWQDELESQSKLADYVVTDNFGEPIGLGKDEADAISDAYMGHPEYWEGDSSTKYGQYVLPGGENYRELLLTLPQGRSVAEIERQWNDMPTSDPRWQSLADERQRALGKGSFKSSHWDEPNILAHIRMNDRVDAGGAKTLFIEEVQSDWGQEGKKKGFRADLNTLSTDQLRTIVEENDANADTDGLPREVLLEMAQTSGAQGVIPTAPFVQDTKAWVALAVKRIMAYAAANGYAKVAFVNGEQSADRYDLSKQVSRIEYAASGGSQKQGRALTVKGLSGSTILSRNAFPEELPELIGKEAAEKLLASEPVSKGGAVKFHTIEGDGLKVGGEGMKAFYDRIVPQVVSDVLKRVGGGKMEEVRVSTSEDDKFFPNSMWGKQPGFSVTPAMRQPMPLFTPVVRATLPAETKAQAAQRKGQDKFNRFGTLKEWAAANGLKLSEQADVYRAEERYHGRVATRLEDFREKTLKPLIEKIHKAGFTMQDVAAFLEAQHTPEANAHIRKLTNDPKATAAGVTDADAAAYLAQANPALKRVANEFRQITEQSKRLLLKSGLISQDQADAWSGAYQHYVPLKGGPEETAARTGQGPGMSVNAKQKRRLGHGKRAEFVIENIIRDHERAILLAEKNLVGQHLLQAAIELQQLDPDLITIGKPEKRKVYVPGKTTYAIDYNGSTVAAFDSENEARRFLTFMGKSGMAIRKITGDPHIQMTAAPMLQENEAGVYVQGQLVRVQINDEILARAYKNLGVENLNAVLRGARHINTWLSKAYTGLNPEFILVNMARDFTGGLINITGNYGGSISLAAIANYPKAMMEILAHSMRGKTSTNVQQYRDNGGSTGGAYLSDLERVGQDVEAHYNKAVGVMENLGNRKVWNASRAASRKTFGFLTGWIEHMNAASENAMRLAVFMAVRDKTGSLAEAASAAKNATVNFNRTGEAGKAAGALYLFANPNIQGTAALWKALVHGEHKGQAWALVAAMTALAMLASLQFDDDEWKKIPEFEKDRNLLIRFGENRIKIPVPYGYGFFFGLGNVYRNIQAGDSVGKVSAHLASALFEHFSPFGNPVQSVSTMAPTAIKIPMQHWANVNDFDRQIVPEGDYNKNKPDFLKMNRSTKGTAFDAISRGLNEMSGGTAGTSGAIDISPETTKTLWRTMTGGTGAFWTDLFSYGRLVYEDADRDLHEVPVVRKFAAEPRITDVRANYFEEVDKAKKVLDQFNAAKKEHDQDGMDKLKAEKEMLALARASDYVRKAVKAIRDKQDSILNDTTKPLAYRRAEVKQLERKEAELYQRILKSHGD